MTPDEITASDDVGALYDELRSARADDDHDRVRLVEGRLREIGDERGEPHPHRDPDEGEPVITSPSEN